MFENGHLSEEEIAIYADAAISGNLKDISFELKSHVRDCDECADKILAVTEITNDLLKEEKITSTKTVDFNKKKLILRVAASLVLLIGLSAIVIQFKHFDKLPYQKISELEDSVINTQIFKEKINKNKPAIRKLANRVKNNRKSKPQSENINTELLAYVEHKDLEKLVERFSDSALRGGFNINMQPSISIKLNEPVILDWENPNEELLIIEFFDNKANKLFEVETSENIYKTTELKIPGLYYWKLINEDFDLLFCGKIVIK